jgi:GDP/UDP-N,N'-diacetylbacillosamine 2-epimerase (hydrolysing)
MRRLAIVTTSRADYGLLKPVVLATKQNDNLDVRLIVSGGHLLSSQGNTVKEILDDGIEISHQVHIPSAAADNGELAHSFSSIILEMTRVLKKLEPEIILLLGDRYEVFGTALAATFLKIPIAHMHGGEITSGALDDVFRHCITKLSFWHFVAHEEYRNRVIQLGESPERVFLTGATFVENIQFSESVDSADLYSRISVPRGEKYIAVTVHPETIGNATNVEFLRNLLRVLDYYKDFYVVFTGTNDDPGGRDLTTEIQKYVELNSMRCRYYTSLGSKYYLSFLNDSSLVVGNSSSGVTEAPYLGVPSINIGDRQDGRIKDVLVTDCSWDEVSIRNSFRDALAIPRRQPQKMNSKRPSHLIAELLATVEIPNSTKKYFFDLPFLGLPQ